MDPEYEEYRDNSKFKSYVSDFASSLTLFEKAKEWADLIKCLQRVTSIFKKYSQFPAVVPEKLVFCKRLSQCCNPALPSGVHLKTLETYEIVFERIGATRLARDLPYYSVGLFPLFANASMQIRPKIIDIFKTYYLPIGKDLLPCLNGLVMSLVPGLEEQNSEFYRSIVKLLDDVGEKVGQRSLYHCLWKIVSLNPSIRIGAINYLMEKIPKKGKDLDVHMPNTSTLVLNAMIRAIDDPVVLVQRSVLDLLLTHFKLSERIFDDVSLSFLIRRALLLQLRREASLNRRVYTWLLGEEAGQTQDYFLQYSKKALVLALNDMFQNTNSSTSTHQTSMPISTVHQLNQGEQQPITLEKAILPFKILLALFDKPEVSAPIINEIIEDVIESLHRYCTGGYSFTAEIVAQVNTVLDGLRPAIIWNFLNQFVRNDVLQRTSMETPVEIDPVTGAASTTISCRSLTLTATLLDKMIGINSFESLTSFLPEFINSLIYAANLAARKQEHFPILLSCCQLIHKVIGKMQQPVARHSMQQQQQRQQTSTSPPPTSSSPSLLSGPSTQPGPSAPSPQIASPTPQHGTSAGGANANAPTSQQSPLPSTTLLTAIAAFENFYRDLCVKILPPVWNAEVNEMKNEQQANVQTSSLTLGQRKVVFGPGAIDINSSSRKGHHHAAWRKTLSTAILDISSRSLIAFYATFWTTFGVSAPNPSQTPLHEWFDALVHLAEDSEQHPLVSCIAIRTLVSCLNLPHTNPSASKLQSYMLHSTRLCHTMARRLWSLLHPSTSLVHYKTATTFLELKETCSDICEDVICEALLMDGKQNVEFGLEQRLEAHQRFAMLWRLTGEIGASAGALSSLSNSTDGGTTPRGPSPNNKRSFERALFLMLDSLNDEQPIIKLACRTWLADSISQVERILDPLLLVLLDKSTSRSPNGVYQTEYDCRRVLYALKVLQSIIECDFKLWMQNAMSRPISRLMLELYRRQVIPEELNTSGTSDSPTPGTSNSPNNGSTATATPPPSAPSPPPNSPEANIVDAYSYINVETYLDLLVVESLRFITGLPSRSASADFATKNSVVQTTAVGFLQFLLMKITASQKASDLALLLHEPILQALAQSVSDSHLILQVNLLGLIRCIVLIDNANESKARQPGTLSMPTSPAVPHASHHPSSGNAANVAAPKYGNAMRVIDAIGQSQLFLQTVSIGLLQANTDFNIRFYWLDFITSCLPYLMPYAHLIVPPIMQCLCDIISTHKNAYDSVESKDTLMILRAMKIILHHSMNLPVTGDIAVMMGLSASALPPSNPGSSAPSQTSSTTSTSGSSSQGQQYAQSGSGGSGFSTFFKTLFVSEGGASSSSGNPTTVPSTSTIDAVLDRLDILMKGMLKVWGHTNAQFRSTFSDFGPTLTSVDPSTLAPWDTTPSMTLSRNPSSAMRLGKNAHVNLKEADFSSDELHNRYAVQDHLLALLEMLYYTSPQRFITCMLKEWTYVSRHPEQIMGSNAPKLPQDPRFATADYIAHAQKYKVMCVDILNHMSNVSADSLFRALIDSLRTCHAIDQQRSLKLAQAKRRGVNFTHLQDACIAELGVLIVDWGNKFSEQALPAAFAFIRALLTSHNPSSLFQAWRLLDCALMKLAGSGNASGPTTIRGLLANPRVRRELASLVQSMCELSLTALNKSFVDLSCSWKMTTRFVDSYDERSDPVIMDENTMHQVKTFVAVQMAMYLRDHLVSILEKTQDEIRGVMALPSLVQQLALAIQSESIRNPQLAQESAATLEKMANAPQVVDVRVWKKPAMDLFLYWSDFLRVSSATQLKCFQRIVATIFSPKFEDGSGWSELTKYVAKAVAPQTIFTSQLEASVQRALSVRRLAFLILGGVNDQYLDQLPWIQEKLVEALRQRDGHADTFAAVFLCLRVMMTKLKAESMRSFWPAIISEMLGVFYATVHEKTHAPLPPDPELVFAVTKFLDLVFVLPSEQFNIHEWMFISDPISCPSTPSTTPNATSPSQKASSFTPFLDRVSNRTMSILPAYMLDPADSPSSVSSLMPQWNSINAPFTAKKMAPIVPIQKLDVNPNPLGMTWDNFVQWLAKYSDLQYLNRVSTQSYANMDDIGSLLLADFAIQKTLDLTDWTLLRVTSDPASPVAPPTVLPASNSPAIVPTHAHPNAQHAKPTAAANPQRAHSASLPSSLPPLIPSPAPLQQQSPPQQASPPQKPVDVEDNANATLFGDVLD